MPRCGVIKSVNYGVNNNIYFNGGFVTLENVSLNPHKPQTYISAHKACYETYNEKPFM